MRDQILKALKGSRADFTDIRIEREWQTQVLYRRDNLENLAASLEVGGIVRCLVGGGWGIVVFNSLDDLGRRVEEACQIARTVGRRVAEKVHLAPVEPVQAKLPAHLGKDPRSVPLRQKQELLQSCNAIMLRGDSRIVTTMASYSDSFREITLANSEGTFIVEERPDVTLLLMATAREGETNIQTGIEHEGWVAGFEAVEDKEEMAEKALRRALDLLQARPARGGNYTVVLDPELTGVFIHEAFGHLCEADFVSKNPRLMEILQPGRQFGVPELNVIDDGYVPNLRGNTPYDDEGTPRRQVYLIRDGILQGFMHSRETAARMGSEPTGNARAVSYHFEPIVRMRNTYIDRGSVPLEEMVRGIDHGIYACKALGGQTELEQFTFSAAYAYQIEHGQVGEMARDVVLTGNVFETLRNIDSIGDDLNVRGGAGGCGKQGQNHLATTMGGPHIRIQDVTIGGRVE